MSFQNDFSTPKPVNNPSPSTGHVQPGLRTGSVASSEPNSRPVIHRWDEQKHGEPSMKKSSKKLVIGLFALVVVAGIGTGLAGAYFMPGSSGMITNVEQTEEITDNQVKNGAVFGLPDTETFDDKTEGVLIKGGLEGEGSHTLLRPNGVSQNVYLTSSAVDLDQFVDMEIRVWGETFKGQKAGWLMDVGRVEVINTTGEKPEWYSTNKK
jgi:hypothetical protein